MSDLVVGGVIAGVILLVLGALSRMGWQAIKTSWREAVSAAANGQLQRQIKLLQDTVQSQDDRIECLEQDLKRLRDENLVLRRLLRDRQLIDEVYAAEQEPAT